MTAQTGIRDIKALQAEIAAAQGKAHFAARSIYETLDKCSRLDLGSEATCILEDIRPAAHILSDYLAEVKDRNLRILELIEGWEASEDIQPAI